MSVFEIQTYVVKSEKREEFTSLLNEFLKFKETHKELFKGLKSWKLYKQEYGSISGLYIEMWEFDSFADIKANSEKIHNDDGMKKILQEFHRLVEPATLSASIWNLVA